MLIDLKQQILKLVNRIRPRTFFYFTGTIYGLLMLLITPPFQVPDGFNHFYKAYQVSTGEFLPCTKNNRLGGYVPKSFVQFANSFSHIPWYPDSKTNSKETIEQFSIPLNEDDKVFVDFPNTALYSPVSYIPQAVSIYILRKFGLSPALIFYLTRLFVLIIWLLSFSLVLKIIPARKWLFAFLGLLPMSVFINMSFSADVVTNILSFLLIAFIFNISKTPKKLSWKNFWLIFSLVLLLASAKMVYIPLVLLFLIIPASGFKNRKQQILQTSLLFFVGFGVAFLWGSLANSYYIPYEKYNKIFRDGITLMPCSDAAKQIEYILNNGFYIVEVIFNSMVSSFEMYFKGYIGTFGWLDTHLPLWSIIITYLSLISISFSSQEPLFNFKIYQQLVFVLVILAIIVLLLLTQHLSWGCVGDRIIHTIQGRYFSPVFPLLFVIISDTKFRLKPNTTYLAVLFFIFLLSYSVYTLLVRYY